MSKYRSSIISLIDGIVTEHDARVIDHAGGLNFARRAGTDYVGAERLRGIALIIADFGALGTAPGEAAVALAAHGLDMIGVKHALQAKVRVPIRQPAPQPPKPRHRPMNAMWGMAK